MVYSTKLQSEAREHPIQMTPTSMMAVIQSKSNGTQDRFYGLEVQTAICAIFWFSIVKP